MEIITLTLGIFRTNCYLLISGSDGAIIDPGFDSQSIIQAAGLGKFSHILLTHAHIDHVGAVAELKSYYQAQVLMAEQEQVLLDNLEAMALRFGMAVPPSFAVDRYIEDGDVVQVGEESVTVIATPGHSPGGLCFRAGGVLFAGDVLFKGAIGRTDLYGGSLSVLKHSIESKLFTLPDEVILYPGHGPATTIGREKRDNPFFSLAF
jgi:hydroxyacylglutathione hydrolase